MPSLLQLTQGNVASPIITEVINAQPIVEPLDGPTPIDDYMDRFPPETYQQGKDTHLYRLMTVLLGDAGIGLLKKQAHTARLAWETEFINYNILDSAYAGTFGFHRLRSETYDLDPRSATLTLAQEDAISLADRSYYHRIQEFFTATRYGTSPTGLATVATAGSGIPTDVIEHYPYIFDLYSDDPLGLTPYGVTLSTAEFVLVPRYNLFDSVYSQPWGWGFSFSAPSFNTGSRPAQVTVAPSVTKSYSATAVERLTPDIERNVIDLVDRLRPVGSLATIYTQPERYTTLALHGSPFASSGRIVVQRFTEGRQDVMWPTLDANQGHFIEAGIEHEAPSFFTSRQDLPVTFFTLEGGIKAYSETALSDPTYGTPDFYLSTDGTALVDDYSSMHIGHFDPTFVAVFPYLSQVTEDMQFAPENAVANQDTTLVVEGKAIA